MKGGLIMNDVFMKIKMLFAVIGGFLGYYIGGIDTLITALIIFVIMDYVTGVTAGWYTKTLSSNIGLRGIVKKIMLFVLVAVAVQVDLVFGSNNVLRSAVIFFLLANEGLSILENLGKMDIGIPPMIKKALESMKEDK
jgi:toxin secretion/phage lysis holin